jgi:hypothetical protein
VLKIEHYQKFAPITIVVTVADREDAVELSRQIVDLATVVYAENTAIRGHLRYMVAGLDYAIERRVWQTTSIHLEVTTASEAVELVESCDSILRELDEKEQDNAEVWAVLEYILNALEAAITEGE